MAVTRIATSSVKTPAKYISMLGGNASYVPPAFESIATVTAAGGETSLSFTSIPSTYKSLQIRGIGRDTAASSNMRVQFNSDTGANYTYHWLTGDGSAASATGSTGSNFMIIASYPGSAATANIFTTTLIDIVDYASTTKNKTLRALSGCDSNATGVSQIRLMSGGWFNTSAITSIQILIPVSAVAGTTFALYGIKG